MYTCVLCGGGAVKAITVELVALSVTSGAKA